MRFVPFLVRGAGADWRKTMKRILVLIWALALILGGIPIGSKAMAASKEERIVVLGADLTEAERASVLIQMGLNEEELKSCKVLTVTNAMEHDYLDTYLDPKVIGTRSLSSVMLTGVKPGSGVLVTTKNINYCTTGMYRNALLTAGVEDVAVLVVGPSPISGTAALIGAMLAYQEMIGEAVETSTLDTALNELITTGNIAGEAKEGKQIEELFAYIKGKLAAGELDTRDEIEQAIAEGEEKFQMTLTEEQKEQILQVMEKITQLGLDPEKLLDQAKDMYEKWGTDLVNHTQEAIKKSVTESIESYFTDMVTTVKDFLKGLF